MRCRGRGRGSGSGCRHTLRGQREEETDAALDNLGGPAGEERKIEMVVCVGLEVVVVLVVLVVVVAVVVGNSSCLWWGDARSRVPGFNYSVLSHPRATTGPQAPGYGVRTPRADTRFQG